MSCDSINAENDKRKKSTESPSKQGYNISVLRLELNGEALIPETYVRVVEPYEHVFTTHAKRRWLGRTVLDVYCSEFGSYPRSYYEAAIRQGKIRLSGKEVDVDHEIKDNHVLSHAVHLHEAGVIVAGPEDDPVNVVAETDELVVVDKPGTMPVHPCGSHMQNSLTAILSPRFGKLCTIHRLDRLTSGLVLLAKNSKVAQKWSKVLMERDTCEKVYLARVKGEFPLNAGSNLLRLDGDTVEYGTYQDLIEQNGCQQRRQNALGFWLTDSVGNLDQGALMEDVFKCQQSLDDWFDGTQEDQKALWLHLACPTRVSSHKNGVCEAGDFDDITDSLYAKSVKPAQTSFGVVRYDDATDSTILLCRPKTGRSHQIRLHLQYLGHPIANDPSYGGEPWYGDEKGGKACKEAATKLHGINDGDTSEKIEDHAGLWDAPITEEEITGLAALKRDANESMDDFIKRTCVWCARSRGDDVARAMLELLVRSRGIWLHALMYKMMDSDGVLLNYRTKAPSWSGVK